TAAASGAARSRPSRSIRPGTSCRSRARARADARRPRRSLAAPRRAASAEPPDRFFRHLVVTERPVGIAEPAGLALGEQEHHELGELPEFLLARLVGTVRLEAAVLGDRG